MALKFGFFDSKSGDRRYKSEDFAHIFGLLMTNGVYANPSTSLQVVEDTNMTVNIKAGFGVVLGRYIYNTDNYAINLNTANGVYDRIDRIVLRLNMTLRSIQLIAVTGVPSASPVAPALVRDGTFYDLSLATILVGAGVTAITQSNITDTRSDNAVCGWVTGAVEQIDTTELFAQYEAAWQDFVEQLGNDERVTINTADEVAREQIKAINARYSIARRISLI